MAKKALCCQVSLTESLAIATRQPLVSSAGISWNQMNPGGFGFAKKMGEHLVHHRRWYQKSSLSNEMGQSIPSNGFKSVFQFFHGSKLEYTYTPLI